MKRVLYLFFFFKSLLVYSQEYHSQWYNSENLLMNDRVTDIIKDRYNNLWLLTGKGVLRFDGKIFLQKTPEGLNNAGFYPFRGSVNGDHIIVENIYDENSSLLISNRKVVKKNVKAYLKSIFYQNKYMMEVISNSISIRPFYSTKHTFIIQTSTGDYYFSTDTKKINFENAQNGLVETGAYFNNDMLKNVFTYEDKIFLPDKIKKKVTGISEGKTFIVKEVPKLFFHKDSFIFWNQTNDQTFLIHNSKIYLCQYSNGELSARFLMDYRNFYENTIKSIFYDETNNQLYLGTLNKGLNVITFPDFHVIKKKLPFADNIFYAFLPNGKKSVITTDGYAYTKNSSEKIFEANDTNNKFYLGYDNKKNLIFSNLYAVLKRSKSSKYLDEHVFPFQSNIEGIFAKDDTYCLSLSKNGKRWFNIYEDSDFQFLRHKVNLHDAIVFSVSRIGASHIFVCTSKGLYKVSLKNGKIINVILKGVQVKHLIKTKDGSMWLTTFNNGFFLLQNEKPIAMPSDQNDYIKTAHYILEDEYGFFWISSNNGLFKVNKKLLLEFAKNNKTKVVYYRFSKNDGFLNNEFNGSSEPCAAKLDNGEFVYPSMDGIVFFDPKNVKTYYPKSNDLFLERVLVDNKEVATDKYLITKNNYEKIEFQFNLPYYHDFDNIYLEGRLLNSSDNAWFRISDDRKVNFNKLDPGNYKLQIRYLTDNSGNFTYKSYTIDIQPFFYQTLLFKVIVLLLTIIFVVVLIQLRTTFLRNSYKNLKSIVHKRNNELSKLEIEAIELKEEAEFQNKVMQMIGHDLTTPAKYISDVSYKLSKAKTAENQQRYFESIYESAEQLFQFTLELRNYADLNKEENHELTNYNVRKVVESKRLLFKEIALQNDTHICNMVDLKIHSTVNKNVLLTILHNLLDNAVKNTRSGTILINSDDEDSLQPSIAVKDTGSGMSEEQIDYYNQLYECSNYDDMTFVNYGLGLHMVVKLVKKVDKHYI